MKNWPKYGCQLRTKNNRKTLKNYYFMPLLINKKNYCIIFNYLNILTEILMKAFCFFSKIKNTCLKD